MEERLVVGSLSNSMRFRFSFICLPIVACTQIQVETPQNCVERVSQSKIVRVDEVNQRYFLVASNETVNLLASHSTEVLGCFKDSEWAGQWSLSIFSAPEFAGYMDEADILPFHEGDAWSKAYLAEFDGAAVSLIENPTGDAKERIVGK